jgi:hypothetical protein
MAQDKYNRKDYSAIIFGIALVLAALFIMLKDSGFFK